MAKKKHHEEHENHERWVVSYADFMTLLFALFVVLYSVSKVDTKKMVQTQQALQWALHFEGTGGVGAMPIFEGPPSEGGCAASQGSSPVVDKRAGRTVEALRKRLERRLKSLLLESKTSKLVTVEIANGRLQVRMATTRFFDTGQAALRPEALPVLDAMGEELAELKRGVRIEGHTDDAALGTSRFRSNWELSGSRAAAVVDYLEKAHHLDPALLSAAGMGSSRPLVNNDTPDNRELNRRVELVIELAPDDAITGLIR